MNVVIFILKFLEASIGIALFNYVTVLFYTYLEEWKFDLLDYKEELEENKEGEKRDTKNLKIVGTMYQIFSKFVSTYEWIFRHLDPLNLFAIWDEEE